MDKLIGKLRVSAFISVIIIILSITWMVLDYFVLRNVLTKAAVITDFGNIILKISIGVFGLLIITFLVHIYYSLRVSRKAKSEINKVKNEIEKNKENTIMLNGDK